MGRPRKVMSNPDVDDSPYDWNSLPTPVLREILSRVGPAADRTRLAVVCKKWQSILSQPKTWEAIELEPVASRYPGLPGASLRITCLADWLTRKLANLRSITGLSNDVLLELVGTNSLRCPQLESVSLAPEPRPTSSVAVSELAALPKLKSLANLSVMVGSGCFTYPSNLAYLAANTNLLSLGLAINQQPSPFKLCSKEISLPAFTSITELQLSFNCGMESLSLWLDSLVSLRSLYLQFTNPLQGSCSFPTAKALTRVTSLTLAATVCPCFQLQLPQGLASNMSRLRHLAISLNPLPVGAPLPVACQEQRLATPPWKLITNVPPEDAGFAPDPVELPLGVAELRNLECLELEGLLPCAQTLQRLSSLTALKLASCSATSERYMPWLSAMPRLVHLDVSNNRMSTIIPHELSTRSPPVFISGWAAWRPYQERALALYDGAAGMAYAMTSVAGEKDVMYFSDMMDFGGERAKGAAIPGRHWGKSRSPREVDAAFGFLRRFATQHGAHM